MPDTLELEVATPERLLVRESVDEVQIPAQNGYMGILPGHAPLLGQLGTGFLSYSAGGRKRVTFRCTAVSSKCCPTTSACSPIRPSAPKISTWSARARI